MMFQLDVFCFKRIQKLDFRCFFLAKVSCMKIHEFYGWYTPEDERLEHNHGGGWKIICIFLFMGDL